jgi:hypothetical protein
MIKKTFFFQLVMPALPVYGKIGIQLPEIKKKFIWETL